MIGRNDGSQTCKSIYLEVRRHAHLLSKIMFDDSSAIKTYDAELSHELGDAISLSIQPYISKDFESFSCKNLDSVVSCMNEASTVFFKYLDEVFERTQLLNIPHNRIYLGSNVILLKNSYNNIFKMLEPVENSLDDSTKRSFLHLKKEYRDKIDLLYGNY